MPTALTAKDRARLRRVANKAPKEASIEQKVVDWAKERGCRSRKMNGLGFRSWPDRLFVIPGRGTAWVEFKRPGEQPTEQQYEMLGWLAKAGQLVIWTDSADEAMAFLLKCGLRATPLPTPPGSTRKRR